MKMFLALILLTLTSCAGLKDWSKKVMEPKSDMDEVHEYHRPLQDQHLIPRPGYEGHLTNRVCLKWYGDKCEQESIKKYDLKDKKVRDTLIRLNFACWAAEKRYRVCSDKPGFCRKEKKRTCTRWGRTLLRRKRYCKSYKNEITKTYLDGIKDYEFLLNSSIECEKGM